MGEKKSGANQALQAERRRLLIDATMSAISEYGLARLTLARIAEIAGLSAGTVNFHFSSKEALLLDTLTYLAEEFEQSIDRAMAGAGRDPASRLTALFEASLNPEITEPRKMAVWFAFVAEARGREDYQRICGTQDRKIFNITVRLCDELIRRGDNASYMNARAMASAVQGLVDEIWQEILYAGDAYDRDDARFIYLSFLASVFPWAFDAPGEQVKAGAPLSTEDKSLRVVRAGAECLLEVSALFDLYRQYYGEPADARLAKRFIGDNIRKERSVIFLALDREDKPLGFTQLYPGWCSVAARPIWTLYDLYVDAAARQRGVGHALMAAAEAMARKSRACRLDLETAVDNYGAQLLYDRRGWKRDTGFYRYSLELD
jgi:TetR/AcrR family transcriptional repressor of bet genes